MGRAGQNWLHLKRSNPPPLPASISEWWHSEISCTGLLWTGQRRGVVLPGDAAIEVATDPPYFNGRVVAKSAAGIAGYLTTTISPGLVLVGAYPYVFAVLRAVAVPSSGTTNYLLDIGGAASPAERFAFNITNFAGAQWGAGIHTSGNASLSGSADTLPHNIEIWTESVGPRVRIDGVSRLSQSADRPATADWTALRLGTRVTSPATQVAAVSYAFLAVCTAKPSEAECTALRAWATSYWATP